MLAAVLFYASAFICVWMYFKERRKPNGKGFRYLMYSIGFANVAIFMHDHTWHHLTPAATVVFFGTLVSLLEDYYSSAKGAGDEQSNV